MTDNTIRLTRHFPHPPEAVWKALTTPDLLARWWAAGDIAALFKHAWPTTTRHLQVLEEAGLIRHERQGRTRLYRIDKKRLATARAWLDWFWKSTG